MKPTYLLLAPLLFAFLVTPYSIQGIFPNHGPTTGGTRVSIFSSTFKGMNYTDHPSPKCQFEGESAEPATWIHCVGGDTTPGAPKDETCLNCETPAHAEGSSKVKVSIKGDFTDTAEITFTYYTQPTLGWITPQLGWKKGSTPVQVHGDNFANLAGLGCAFGSVNVPAKFVSPQLVTCNSPPSDIAGEPVPIRVTLNDQQYTSDRVHYFYTATAEVSQLIPNEGAISGGTDVWIMGRQMFPFEQADVQFGNTTFARFGPDKYMPLELVNSTHAKTTSPPSSTPSSVPVEITFNNLEWTDNGILFHYYVAPYVVKLVPDLGVIEGGTNVTVLGANFQNTSTLRCRFGTNSVEAYYSSDNTAWCITPASDTVGLKDFGISNENERYSSNNIKFLYVKKPVISSISPSCGPTSGMTQIAVTGENFVYRGTNKASCIFGDDIYQPATVINETLIYCDSPNLLDIFGNNVNGTDQLHFRLTLNDVEITETDFNFTYYTLNDIVTINPKIGPVTGGIPVIVSGTDFSRSCKVTCRFATVDVPGSLSNDNTAITCIAPATGCPGDSLVQVSLNGQQYTTNKYEDGTTSFSHYQLPVASYAVPTSFPTSGVSSIGIYGSGFLLSKNDSVASNGEVRLFYQCRFSDATSGTVIGVTNSTYFSNYYVYCRTPQVDNATKNVVLEVSPNGQVWVPVPSEKISFYNAHTVTSVEPSFGRVRENNTELTVNGVNFNCPTVESCVPLCLFSSPNVKVTTTGTRKSATQITCPIPPLSRPEMTQVQISMNNVDFTPQQVYYTFYDAFVVNVEPAYVPVEGNVSVSITGLGFANTSSLKIRLENPQGDTVLVCGSDPCILPGTYVSPNELTFVMPPQASVKTAAGALMGFNPINVEVSVYGDKFTDNNVQVNYFQQPTVGRADLTIGNETASYTFHANSLGSIFVPITLQVPQGTKEEDFLRRTRILCKYNIAGQEVITEGKLVQYPFPVAVDVSSTKVSVECTLPALDKPGNGTVSIALNGVNFVGKLPVTVIPQLNINVINPQCGPREGGTAITVQVTGVEETDFANKLFFSWSSVCTDPLAVDLFSNQNTITTVTPPAAPTGSAGGFSLVSFAAMEKVQFADDSQSQEITQNHYESLTEFLYYRRPIVTRVYPHAGIITGGTPVTIEGAFFFTNPKFGCTPKCTFGNTTVEAEYISTVRVTCKAPSGALGSFVPVGITMNGQDIADSQTPQTFGYISTPNVDSISPTTGPATGGTMVAITGKDFIDMSLYPEEFTCIFKPIDGKQAAKVVPASYINSTNIVCSTPSGWTAGTITTVEISFNGVDYSSNGQQFKFYQISKISPLSGPAAGGSTITIAGSGLKPDVMKGDAGCKIGTTIVNATTATAEQIECVVPPASAGADFHGRVDLYYTLDGEKWEQVLQGFNYYQQPTITEINPKFITPDGGRITVTGNNLRANFFGATPTCRIDDTVVPANFISNTQLSCNFSSVQFSSDPDHYVEVSLNGASYTDKTDSSKIEMFQVSSVKPPAGLIQGGTQVKFCSNIVF